MATAKAGKSVVGKTTKKTTKKTVKPATKRPAARATKVASSKAPARTTVKKAAAKKVAVKKPAAKTTTARKSVASKPVAKNPAVKEAVAKKAVAKKAVAKKAVAGNAANNTSKVTAKHSSTAATGLRKPVAKTAPKKSMPAKPADVTRIVSKPANKTMPDSTARKSTRKPRMITPEQALANTRALLEAKKEHDRQPQPWQMLDQQAGPIDHAGYQSPEAADKAEQLHAGESRMQAIPGSISSTGRKNQGKRDNS